MTNKLKVCRICLGEADSEEELYEFSAEIAVEDRKENQNFVSILEIYQQLTSIPLASEEEDDSKICSQCLGDLKFSFIFQQKCIESEKIYNSTKFDIEEHPFMIINDVEHVKTEPDPIEYEELEYIQEDNDDDESAKTMDGFEHDGCSKQDSDKCDESEPEIKAKRQRLETTKKRKFVQDAHNKKDKHSPQYSSTEEDHQYQCKKCLEVFVTKEQAREHCHLHSDEKGYLCETCSKSFKNRYQLLLHNRSHTGEKPFECPICKRCFSMSSNLSKHLDTHSDQKNYSCQSCSMLFKTQRSLKFHTVSVHMPEAKVKCPVCEKAFVNKSYLQQHLLYHSGEKNFTCTICASRYYKSSHLKRHIQNVHFKLRLMKCDFCSSDFVRKETYRNHISTHHKRHLTDKEYEDVLEKIRAFKPPPIDINEFTLEKQKLSKTSQMIVAEDDADDLELEQVIEEDDEVVESDNIFYDEAVSEYYQEDEQ